MKKNTTEDEQAPVTEQFRVPNGKLVEHHVCPRDGVVTNTYQMANGETETWKADKVGETLTFDVCSGTEDPKFANAPVRA